jgi:cobalt transporter subunit CbtA
MIARVLIVALLAGLVAGLAAAAVQLHKVTPLILAAETYEGSDAGAGGHSHGEADHDHETGAPDHDAHDHGAWAPDDGLERNAFTILANVLIGIGWALLLVGGFVLSRRRIDWRSGLLWGLGGFAAFALLPAIVLPPEVPGAVAAPLATRQALWFGVALSGAAGLAFLAFGRAVPVKVLGAVLVVAPLFIATPHGEGHGSVPPELAAQFVTASLGMAAVFWVVLGGLSGLFYKRFVAR